ncbi:hypothetical protein B0H11DRAFT_1933994 [Mycena galericulata]|nr:hypothetical protein B0H11DRAFT_1933994 [Mycena galericulata]
MILQASQIFPPLPGLDISKGNILATTAKTSVGGSPDLNNMLCDASEDVPHTGVPKRAFPGLYLAISQRNRRIGVTKGASITRKVDGWGKFAVVVGLQIKRIPGAKNALERQTDAPMQRKKIYLDDGHEYLAYDLVVVGDVVGEVVPAVRRWVDVGGREPFVQRVEMGETDGAHRAQFCGSREREGAGNSHGSEVGIADLEIKAGHL